MYAKFENYCSKIPISDFAFLNKLPKFCDLQAKRVVQVLNGTDGEEDAQIYLKVPERKPAA